MSQTETDTDFPILTDIIDDDDDTVRVLHQSTDRVQPWPAAATPLSGQDRQQLEKALSDKLIGQLSQHLAGLIESAVREDLPAAIAARLESTVMAAVATALPVAAHSAATDLAAHLQHQIEAVVRRSVAEEIARLKI